MNWDLKPPMKHQKPGKIAKEKKVKNKGEKVTERKTVVARRRKGGGEKGAAKDKAEKK